MNEIFKRALNTDPRFDVGKHFLRFNSIHTHIAGANDETKTMTKIWMTIV